MSFPPCENGPLLTAPCSYTALDRSGEVDRLAALHDLGDAPDVDEDAVRAAVDELRRSTQSIAKQTEALRQQQAALQRMITKEADNQARRRDLEASRRRKHQVKYRELMADVSPPTFSSKLQTLNPPIGSRIDPRD